ncbi:unnamed protein product [Prunus armeniaca]
MNNGVELLGLLNRHTNLAPLDSDLINELPIKVTTLEKVHPKSEEAFQQWEVSVVLCIRQLGVFAWTDRQQTRAYSFQSIGLWFCEVLTIKLEGGKDRVGEDTGLGRKARVHDFVDAESLA